MQLALVVAALLTLCSLALAVHSLVPSLVRDSVRRTALRVELPLDETTEPLVVARLASRERWAAAGALAGGLLSVAAVAIGTTGILGAVSADLGGYAVVLGFVAGTGAGVGALASREAARPVGGDGPRVARTSVPRVGDYVAPHERLGAWVLVAACVTVTASAALRPGPGLPGVLVGIATAVPVLALVGTEVLLQRLVRARQAASSPVALAWDDVLRARTARDLVTVPFLAGAYLGLAVVGHGERTGAVPDGLAIPLALALSAAAAAASVLLRPRAHVRRRLWPQPPRPSTAPAAPAGGTP